MKPFDIGWMAWESDGTSGYAHIAEKFHFYLAEDKRLHFSNAYSQEWDALICVATPARFTIGKELRPRPDVIFHTMFEATPVPPGWVDVMNCAGLIWVPSKYSATLFAESGVTTPIIVSGYGIKEHEFPEIDRSDHREETTTMKFILWADTLFSRKNVTKTVRAFIDAALPDAELEVKLHSFAGMNPSTMFSDGKDRPLANVSLHCGAWQHKKLLKWIHSADCGIYGSGGEGFGLMPLQQMSTGLPMICANNTGMLEYLKPDNHLPVLCPKLTRDMTYTIGYGYPAMTFEPDYEQMVEQIRWAYANRDKLDAIGAAGAAEARTWDWMNQTQIAVNAILKHYNYEGV